MNLDKVIIISVTYEGMNSTHTQRQGEKYGGADGKRGEL